MAHSFTLWLGRLLADTAGSVRAPSPIDRKPMKIEVERLPDYRWRELGFQRPRRPSDGE